MPVYDETYIKAKVREFDGKFKTNFLGDGVPKEDMHYTCTACITIDSVMRMEKKNYPQVYLEECKYKVKKIQMSRFINTELESNSESESESESKSDTELMAKLESGSDSEKFVISCFNNTFFLVVILLLIVRHSCFFGVTILKRCYDFF